MAEEKEVTEETQIKPNPLRYAWVAGHVSTIFFTLIYALFFLIFRWNSIYAKTSYRLIFISAIISYSLSLYQKYEGQIPSFYMLLTVGGFHALLEANLWLFSTPSIIKAIPFFLMAALHMASFIQTDLMPNSNVSNQIDVGLKQHDALIELILAESKLVIALRLIFDMFLMRASAGVTLIIYCIIFKIRAQYVPSTYASLQRLVSRIETLVENPKCPAKVTRFWKFMKEVFQGSKSTRLVSEEGSEEFKSTADKMSQIHLRGSAKKEDKVEKKTQ